MCAGVVCEDILFCTMSVLRSSNCTLGEWSVREEACEYMEDFAFGASLVWCRIANIWYLHIIDLHHVATYYM